MEGSESVVKAVGEGSCTFDVKGLSLSSCAICGRDHYFDIIPVDTGIKKEGCCAVKGLNEAASARAEKPNGVSNHGSIEIATECRRIEARHSLIGGLVGGSEEDHVVD